LQHQSSNFIQEEEDERYAQSISSTSQIIHFRPTCSYYGQSQPSNEMHVLIDKCKKSQRDK